MVVLRFLASVDQRRSLLEKHKSRPVYKIALIRNRRLCPSLVVVFQAPHLHIIIRISDVLLV